MVAFPLGSCQVRLGFSCFALLSFCCLFLGADGSAFFWQPPPATRPPMWQCSFG